MPPKLDEQIHNRDAAEARERFVRGHVAKVLNAAERTVRGVASTIELDRDGEIILPKAFANVAEFLRSSSAFLAAHTHRTADGAPPQIGWVLALDVAAEMVEAQFRFATTYLAEQWWRLASDPSGKGIAFSIGFLPVRSVYGAVADLVKTYPELAGPCERAGLAADHRLRVYTEIELLEISAVPVPANREAMQILAAKAGAAAAERAVEQLAAEISANVEAHLRRSGIDPDAMEARIRRLVTDAVQPIKENLTRFGGLVIEAMDRDIDDPLQPDGINEPAPQATDAPAADDGAGDAAGRRAGGDDLRAAAERLRIAADT